MRIWFALTAAGAVCLAAAPALHAQTLVGTWQTTVGTQKTVVEITRRADGRLHGEVYFVGQEYSGNTLNGNPISTIVVQGRHVHFDLDEQPVTFDGDLSADGKSLVGTATTRGPPLALRYERATRNTAWVIDPSPHKLLFVPVEKDVRLEVLDWGGSGPPLVFLAGNGDTAHVFDAFAPLFTGKHHVYGVTRRGFGLSSRPAPTEANYDADRLGDDVLAVIDALKLDRPVLAGHSLAGEELSSIGTRHPERVSGLIYLDASYDYAFYDPKAPGGSNLLVDSSTMLRDLAQLPSAGPSQAKNLIEEIQNTVPPLQTELQVLLKQEESRPASAPAPRENLRDEIENSIFSGFRKYTAIKPPVLAIVAVPHACAANCDDPAVTAREAAVAAQADAFAAGVPSARVVRIPHAQHYVFLSNQADVVREMNAFMDGLH